MKLNKKLLGILLVSLSISFSALSQQLFDTSKKFTQNGQYVQARSPLHKSILSKYMWNIAKVGQKKQPNAIFMAGGPGSGKSYTLDLLAKAGVVNLGNYVMINSDDIKEMIPEYQTFKKIDQNKAADLVHKESSYLKDRIVDEAFKRKVNFILDGTLSDPVRYGKLLSSLTGFKTKIIFVDAPTETLLVRVDERGKRTGRYVPADYVRNSVEQIRKSINELSKVADVTFFITNLETGLIKEIKMKGGKNLWVNTPIDSLSKQQVIQFKILLDP